MVAAAAVVTGDGRVVSSPEVNGSGAHLARSERAQGRSLNAARDAVDLCCAIRSFVCRSVEKRIRMKECKQ